ncbi:MAG: DUF393 domain-containing protein [Pseudomonadota bacterium]|nr:DUF393 domain-containing protein [Pseudomonadota bacterium]
MTNLKSKQPTITVYYDDQCPLCTREINFYKRKIEPKDAHWKAISNINEEKIDKGKALEKLHVSDSNGNLFVGTDAFIEIWARIPQLNKIAKVMKIPIFKIFLEIGYEIFLILRKHTWRRQSCTKK